MPGKIVRFKDKEASHLDQHSMPAPMINEETRSLEQLLHADVLEKEMKIGGGTAAGTDLGNVENNKKVVITPIYNSEAPLEVERAIHDST